MPAGLSQRIQSNLVRRSAIMLPTPSSVRASLSLVWDAGSSHKFSSRLSRIRACESFATPCTTLMRSNTTRRSAPMTRSRLRRPTSKSTTTTFSPICADAAFARRHDQDFGHSCLLCRLIERCNFHDIAIEPCLGRPIAQGGAYVFSSLVVAVDRQELCFDFLTVNPRG